MSQRLKETAQASHEAGRFAEAEAIYRRLLLIEPRSAALHSNMGLALMEQQRWMDATASLRAAQRLSPSSAGILTNLGIALHSQKLLNDAAETFEQALAIEPRLPEALTNLGHVRADQGRFDEAIRHYQAALAVAPGMTLAWRGLGAVCHDIGDLDGAASALEQAIRRDSRDANTWQRLGNVLKDQGKITAAMTHYRNAANLAHDAQIAGHLTYASMFDPACDAAQFRIDLEACDALAKTIPRVPNTSRGRPRDGERLRIGYLSTDFREHVIGLNLLPLLMHHDRERFEIVCYSAGPKPDYLTPRFMAAADRWREVSAASDANVVKQVIDDQIDILVDCSMHLGGNRFRVIAARPAPVQVAFAAYPGSAATRAIDYRLSDPYLDPPGNDESIYLEKTIRLPHSFWCYAPLSSQPDAGPLPADGNGFVTFGSLNYFGKINDHVLQLWARILSEVPQSQLILRCPAGSSRQRVLAAMGAAGVEGHRIEFVGNQRREDYLATYCRIDIALDPFPYNGHTTSLDALWMGVPVVSLAGHFPWTRAGCCQLMNLQLENLCGKTPDEYLQIATSLAGQRDDLRALRVSLRSRMEQSPLMDAAAFARGIESAYSAMQVAGN